MHLKKTAVKGENKLLNSRLSVFFMGNLYFYGCPRFPPNSPFWYQSQERSIGLFCLFPARLTSSRFKPSQQAAVDRNQSGKYQSHAHDGVPSQPFVQEDDAEQDRAQGD